MHNVHYSKLRIERLYAGNAKMLTPSSVSSHHQRNQRCLLISPLFRRYTYACLQKVWLTTPNYDTCLAVAVDGGWNKWTEWGECSVTCEDGLRRRTRVCDYPPPLRGGTFCSDVDWQTKPCTMIMCPGTCHVMSIFPLYKYTT